MNYNEIVKKNMEFMQSKICEWSAVPIIGVDDAVIENGVSKKMPIFDFPQGLGFKTAPSLFANQGDCCNLCGTNIKNVFWIQNIDKHWIMPVGSECVTRFGQGDSGQELINQVVWANNLKLLLEILKLKRTLWKTFSKRISLGYDRYETNIWPHSENEKAALQVFNACKVCLGKVNEESNNAAITRWINRKGNDVNEVLRNGETLMVMHNNHKVVLELFNTRRLIWEKFSKRQQVDNQRSETKIWPHSETETAALAIFEEAAACLGEIRERSDNASITLWMNVNGNYAQEIIAKGRSIALVEADQIAAMHR